MPLGHRVGLYLCACTLLLGCSAEGEVASIAVDVAPGVIVAVEREEGGASVRIDRFSDVRRDKPWLGTRLGRFGVFGGYTFGVSGGDVGAAVGDGLRRYLRRRGWHVVDVSQETDGGPDILLEGEVRQLRVEVLNGWFASTVTCKTNVLVQGENRVDGSRLDLSLAAELSREVWWFEPQVVETMVNEVLVESYAQLVASTRFEGKHLVAIRR